MVRYLIAQDWWPARSEQEYRYITARTYASSIECHPNCSFRDRVARGDNLHAELPTNPRARPLKRVSDLRSSSRPVGNSGPRYLGSVQPALAQKRRQNEFDVSRYVYTRSKHNF